MRTIFLAIVAITFIQWHALGEGANPYSGVARRNVFALKPTSEVITTNAPAPTSAIKVFGVLNLFGYMQAVMQIDGANFILREGEIRNGVEVLRVQSGGLIDVRNQGVKQELSLESAADHAGRNRQPQDLQ